MKSTALPQDTIPGTRLKTLQGWLKTCKEAHPRCRNSAQEFYHDFQHRPPRRFIHVGNPGQTNVRLVEMSTTPSKPYVALSYCWGPLKLDYITTCSRLEDYKRQIPWDALPQTIKDAIIITQILDIPYLWVDALCIVQRSVTAGTHGQAVVDQGDWMTESIKMAGLYRHAVLTIVVASASSATEGFLATISDETPPAAPSDNGMGLFNTMKDSPHGKRGWTFQEVLLSTRILYFYDRCVAWECKSTKGWENTDLKDLTEVTHTTESRDVTLQPVDHLTYWQWVFAFTSRSLTQASDRPVAMFGVLEHYSRRRMDERVTGLWKRTLLEDLLWRAGRPGNRLSCNMPTWSWMSIDSVIWTPSNVAMFPAPFIPTVDDIEITDLLLATEDPNSWIGYKTLRLTGVLQTAKVVKNGDGGYGICMLVGGQLQEPQHCLIDCENEIPADGQVQCLWLAMLFGYPGFRQFADREILVLVPDKTGTGTYHRIGTGRQRIETLFQSSEITHLDDSMRVLFSPFKEEENCPDLGFNAEPTRITLR